MKGMTRLHIGASALVLTLFFAPLMAPGVAHGQETGVEAELARAAEGWNSFRSLELIERARVRRMEPRIDTGLENYRALASGHVYFFLDRSDSDERSLIRADQIALEVYWAAPNRTKQRIVGMRDESRLPNQMHYHLDHLTIVQDEFGDLIRLGDGDEVRDVLHPVAPASDLFYDFRVVDSLTIRLPGSADPIRVHEVEVRPRYPDRPAFIGSIFIDQATAAIVRMNFTFTPASYVDQRLDYIQVGLDNGLWDGRYWLPHEQTLEIRRQVPILDFPTGGLIRGVFRVSGYEFNQELPPNLFTGARVVAAPRSERESHDFEDGLYAGLTTEELVSAPVDIESLRRQAAGMLGRRYLSGLPRLRVYIPNASAALRYNRAESLYLGGGLSYAAGSASRLRLTGGYATGPGHLALSGEWRVEAGSSTDLWLRTERNALRDLGLRPAVPGVLNTIAAAGFGEDYLDPYYATGAQLGIETRLGTGWAGTATLAYEDQRSAALQETSALLDGDAAFRPVRPIADGALARAELSIARIAPLAFGLTGRLGLEAGHFDGASYLRPTIEAAFDRVTADRRGDLRIRAAAGLVTGSAPPQRLFLLGGPGTLPGYGHRTFAGDRFALLELEAAHDLASPWIRLRAVGAAGWTDFGEGAAPVGWGSGPTTGIRTSVGGGVGLFYDLLRIDLVRGLRHGGWQWVFSVSPAIADLM